MAIRWQMHATWLSPEDALRSLIQAYVAGGCSLDGDVDIALRRSSEGGIRLVVLDAAQKEKT